ncbi:hypothetical protein LINPERHAP2_LOCUS3360 [Linum perenne]
MISRSFSIASCKYNKGFQEQCSIKGVIRSCFELEPWGADSGWSGVYSNVRLGLETNVFMFSRDLFSVQFCPSV